MKKILLSLALVLGAALFTSAPKLHAAGASTAYYDAAEGVTVFAATRGTLDSIVIDDIQGGTATLEICDSAKGLTYEAGTNSSGIAYNINTIKYNLVLQGSLTQTAWSRVIPIGTQFTRGLTIIDTGTNTPVATMNYSHSN
jgi:hypothetical protein